MSYLKMGAADCGNWSGDDGSSEASCDLADHWRRDGKARDGAPWETRAKGDAKGSDGAAVFEYLADDGRYERRDGFGGGIYMTGQSSCGAGAYGVRYPSTEGMGGLGGGCYGGVGGPRVVQSWDLPGFGGCPLRSGGNVGAGLFVGDGMRRYVETAELNVPLGSDFRWESKGPGTFTICDGQVRFVKPHDGFEPNACGWDGQGIFFSVPVSGEAHGSGRGFCFVPKRRADDEKRNEGADGDEDWDKVEGADK